MDRRIVVGVDGSTHSREAWRFALEEARLRHAKVQVVHAYRGPPSGRPSGFTSPVTWPSRDFLETQALRVLDQTIGIVPPDVTADRIATPESPATALGRIGRGADLIVIGSRGRGGFAGLLLGSVGQQVVRHAPCPVVVVPAVEGVGVDTDETS